MYICQLYAQIQEEGAQGPVHWLEIFPLIFQWRGSSSAMLIIPCAHQNRGFVHLSRLHCQCFFLIADFYCL